MDRSLLLVHAHPDDEVLGSGATMAKYAAEGAHVTLVTCTLGEEGEILVPELAHLASDREDALGQYRIGELDAACAALGVEDHRFLGGPGRWRDSGMEGTPQNERPDVFWNADIDEATKALVEVMREVKPQVVITYDENGAYGHPDHIQAHRVTVAAFERSGDPSYQPSLGAPWQPTKLYYTALPKSMVQAGIDLLKETGDTNFFGVDSADELPFAVADELVDAEIDARDFLDQKVGAMRAHATQIAVDGPFFALSNNIGQKAMGIEYFIQARPGRSGGERETDLFGDV